MGIRIIVEAMDWAPETLTQREHKVLMILAEDALDGQPGELDDFGQERRVIRQPIGSAKMQQRARVSRPQLYAVLRSLIAKGCLERVTPGGGGHPARYRIPAIEAQACVRENVTQAPVDNPEGCVRENVTQTGAVSANPGHSVSRFAKNTGLRQQPQGTLNGTREMVGVEAPEFAEQMRDRNDAAPPQSLRDHDGPEHDGPDDQQQPCNDTHQSPAADRNARAQESDLEAHRQAELKRIKEWTMEHSDGTSASDEEFLAEADEEIMCFIGEALGITRAGVLRLLDVAGAAG